MEKCGNLLGTQSIVVLRSVESRLFISGSPGIQREHSGGTHLRYQRIDDLPFFWGDSGGNGLIHGLIQCHKPFQNSPIRWDSKHFQSWMVYYCFTHMNFMNAWFRGSKCPAGLRLSYTTPPEECVCLLLDVNKMICPHHGLVTCFNKC